MMEIKMGIRDKWKYVEAKAGNKKRTQKEMFEEALKTQIKLANGEDIKNAKGNILPSWEVDGKLRIKVGRRKLLAHDIDMENKTISHWLGEVKKAYESGEFGHELKELQTQQDDEDKARALKLKNKKK